MCIRDRKKVGDKVVGASINKSGFFKFEAEKVGDDTTLSQIIKLVEEASSSKAPISKTVSYTHLLVIDAFG